MIGRGAIGKPWIFHQISSKNDTDFKRIKKRDYNRAFN